MSVRELHVSLQLWWKIKRATYLFQYMWVFSSFSLRVFTVLFLSKLRNIQTLCLSKVVFWGELALIIKGIIVGIITVILILTRVAIGATFISTVPKKGIARGWHCSCSDSLYHQVRWVGSEAPWSRRPRERRRKNLD
ncbi:hypothetical protein D8B26_002019 [Coccidioides posadasii str. Silveira]|uniref:uncharacterized protein n=1 Tax=Coccidioides posadasii (strain RMSCC 757 / Silveira) TaxID=443226 RepID=UPI001BEF7450|nr:hypothetical protein D8B26_002019 [Coccidioides posadasii str. Silveira]